MSLRELRQSRNLTPTKLSRLARVSRARIYEYESGKRDSSHMSLGTAIRLCDALHVKDLRELLED